MDVHRVSHHKCQRRLSGGELAFVYQFVAVPLGLHFSGGERYTASNQEEGSSTKGLGIVCPHDSKGARYLLYESCEAECTTTPTQWGTRREWRIF